MRARSVAASIATRLGGRVRLCRDTLHPNAEPGLGHSVVAHKGEDLDVGIGERITHGHDLCGVEHPGA